MFTESTLCTPEDGEREFGNAAGIAKKITQELETIRKTKTKRKTPIQIDWVVELGSGWSLKEMKNITILKRINYSDINLSVVLPSTEGHAGELIICRINGQYVIFLSGRVHQYEGYTPFEIVRMTRALCMLNPKHFILTNAAGSINAKMQVGDLVLIKDHLNGLLSPLAGVETKFGPRHVGMGKAYSNNLLSRFNGVYFESHGKHLLSGIYASVPGPEFETPIQVAILSKLMVDMVGMSTTQQCLAIAQYNAKKETTQPIEVAGISLITNIAENGVTPISHELVLQKALESGQKGMQLIVDVIASYKRQKKQ